MEKKTARIINKAKDGITIKANGRTVKMSWEQFNKNFDLDPNNKLIAYMKQDVAEKVAAYNTAIRNAAMASYMISLAGEHKPAMLCMALAEEIKKIMEIGECSIDEALSKVQEKIDEMNNITSDEIFHHKETREEYRNRKEVEARLAQRDEDIKHHTVSAATQTLGDLPGMDKLKEMFNK